MSSSSLSPNSSAIPAAHSISQLPKDKIILPFLCWSGWTTFGIKPITYIQLLVTAVKRQLLMQWKYKWQFCCKCVGLRYDEYDTAWSVFHPKQWRWPHCLLWYVDLCSQICCRYGKNVTVWYFNSLFCYTFLFWWTFCCIEITVGRFLI